MRDTFTLSPFDKTTSDEIFVVMLAFKYDVYIIWFEVPMLIIQSTIVCFSCSIEWVEKYKTY